MITELGHFALALALAVALIQSVLPMIGAARGNAALMDVARPAAFAQVALVLLAFCAMVYAFVTSDFSVSNVYNNSYSSMPLLYKVTGVWGNHEGSLLLWITALTVFGAGVAALGHNLPPTLRARTVAVQGMISAGFIAFILFTSNPFLRVAPMPAEGLGFNPLLQDPGFALHPPMLYLGYVGFSIVFAFAVAALIEGRVDAAWARWVRPWTLAAWIFLTLGIGLGSWWAYYTLGWGGWWVWDPVENVSFMPWLAGTALLHSAIVVEKREALKSWTILLSIVAFSLSLMGTFLVRSGLLTSVHSFAADPTRGLFILALLGVAIGGSLLLYAMRAPQLEGGGAFAPISREGGLLINNLLLTTCVATVLLGTVYPIVTDALNIGKITVGRPYFDMVFVPVMIPLIALMGVGPMLSWKRADLGPVLARLKLTAAMTAIVIVITLVVAGVKLIDIGAAVGMGAAVWLGLATVTEWVERTRAFRSGAVRRIVNLPRAAHGMTLAHFGMALLIVGISGASAWKQEHTQVLKPGESVEVAGSTLTLEGVVTVPGPNYTALRANITVTRDGKVVDTLHPERRTFIQPPQQTTFTSIRTNAISDLYTVLGDPDGDGYVTRFFYQPLVPFLWYGILLMALGGVVSLTDRRYRVGAPRRAASAAMTGAVPEAAE